MTVEESRKCCILLSGGIDSALVARLLIGDGWGPTALWVDYGQPAAAAERIASRALAEQCDISWTEASVVGIQVPPAGEIPARNDFLVAIARALSPMATVAIGIHAGTPYADSSAEWLAAWNALMDVQHNGVVTLVAPLINLTKADVFALAIEQQVPIEMTYSCEAGVSPCGGCLSCLDRKVALASAKS